jgi:hypothetical protein
MHTVISVGLGLEKLNEIPTVTFPVENIDAYKSCDWQIKDFTR